MRAAILLQIILVCRMRATIWPVATSDPHEHPAGWGAHARRELARTGHRAGGAREQVLTLLERQRC